MTGVWVCRFLLLFVTFFLAFIVKPVLFYTINTAGLGLCDTLPYAAGVGSNDRALLRLQEL